MGFFKGKDRAYFVDRREFDGPIQNQVDAAYQYVLEKINMGMQIQGIYRQDVYELPTDSVRELIANAFAYMKIIEKWGIGIPRIFREYRDYGLPDPELIDFDGDFRVNM